MNPAGLTVLFDGGCPLCGREIAHYRRLKALAPVEWVDITADEGALARFGVGREAAMAQFHVFDAEGRLHLGADGFVALWRALPYYRWLAWVCGRPWLLPPLRWAYARFARWHLRRRCAEGVCR